MSIKNVTLIGLDDLVFPITYHLADHSKIIIIRRLSLIEQLQNQINGLIIIKVL